MDNISEHITYLEATKSQQAARCGIKNIPNPIELAAMKLTAEKVFEPIRKFFDKPIGLSSFYRNVGVNAIIGGSRISQHCKGEAMDIDADIFGGITNKQIFDYIRKNLDYDQLIWEFGTNDNPAWVHVSYSKNNRKQILISELKDGKTYYKNYYD